MCLGIILRETPILQNHTNKRGKEEKPIWNRDPRFLSSKLIQIGKDFSFHYLNQNLSVHSVSADW